MTDTSQAANLDEVARRTLTVSELTFRKKHARNPEVYAPADLSGHNLLDIFTSWARRLPPSDAKDDTRQHWVEINDVRSYSPHIGIIRLGVGTYGEAGPIKDVDTGQTVSHITDKQAPTGENRLVLMVPPEGESAYLLAEESRRGSGSRRVITLFKKHLNERYPTILMKVETVTESEVWSTNAALKEVELRVKGKSADIADGLKIEVGTASYTAHPRRGKLFPGKLL